MPENQSPSKKSSKSRREGVRRTLKSKEVATWRRLLQSPAAIPSMLIVLSFVAIASSLVIWSQRSSVLPAGRIADRTTSVRLEFQVLDEQATEREREKRRDRAPRVYHIDSQLIDSLRTSLNTLPQILSAAETLDQVVPEIRDAFVLTPAQFEAVRAQAVDGEAIPSWRASASALIKILETTPFLTSEEYQVSLSENKRLQLYHSDGEIRTTGIDTAVNIGKDSADQVIALVQRAGFDGPLAQVAGQRLITLNRPTYVHNKEATDAMRSEERRVGKECRSRWSPYH